GIVQLNVTPPASLFSLVSIENSTGIPLNITSGIQLNTSDMIFLYDPFLLDLKLTLAGDSYSVTPNIPYSVPSYASNATLQIYQKIGQSSFLVDEFSWKVNDTASIPDLPTPHIQFLNNSATGQFELDDYLYSFEHLDGMTFIPTRLSPTRIVLPPGEFRVTVTDSNNNSFSFVLDVPSYTSKGRYVAFNSPLLSFSEGYLIGANETFILRDGVYFDGLGNPFFVATSPGFSMPALPYTTNASFVDLVISGARHIEYSINYQNGTMMAGVYNSSIFLNSPIMEEVSLYLAVTDRFGKVHIYDTVVALNQVRNPYSIRVAMRDNSSFPILGLEVQIQQVGVITAFLNNAETTVQLFDHQLTIQNVFTSGIAISFDYSVNYSSREIDLQIFDPWIRIYTNNLNEGLTDAYAGPLIIRDLKSGLMVFNGNISKLQRISIPGSNYSASIVIDDTPYLFQFSVEFARNMAFDLPIKYQEISLTVTKQGNFYIKDIIFQHEILGIIHSGKSERTSSDLEIWSIQSFPYGKMNIKVILSNSRTHLIQLNTEDIPFISIEVTLDFSGINNQFVDSTLLNKGAINVNLGAVSSSAYLESFLGNLITLVKLVFLAEIIVISFILVINILRSIDFFVVLSKKELRTLLSIGTSKGSSILLVSRELFVVTPILSLIGYFAGYGLLSYFVELNHLTLFGKDLTLNPWQLPLILTNLFAVFVMVIVSVFVEIKRINEENLREN
ncbi:MAG: FtsX-like permease family protein, partial [Methanobacteriota archaeon]